MAIPSGLSAQVGYVSESTYGDLETVTRFVPLVDESLTQEIERQESEGIIAGARVRRSAQWAPGNITIEGDISHELYQQGLGVLFTHMFGSATSSATGGVATHTFTPGDLTGQSLTVQVGRPDVNGTVYAFTYGGVKIASWELGLSAGEIATLGVSVLGQSETTGVALATASFLTNATRPFTFVDGAISISGDDVCVREMTLSGDNGLADDRRCIGQQQIDEPLEQEYRTYEGTATIEFSTTAQYERFTQGLETPLVFSLSASASAQATFTLNTRWDGATPEVGGKELLVVDYPYTVVAPTDDASAITAVLVNSQTTP